MLLVLGKPSKCKWIIILHFTFQIDWLKEQGIGGIMLWSLDLDDFKGTSCGTKYPLLRTISTELEGYRVALTYDGPLEGSVAGKKAKTDRKLHKIP